jgi:hypothetical protein
MGILMPFSAPGFVILAAIATAVATVLFPFYIKRRLISDLSIFAPKKEGFDWAKAHYIQAIIVGVGIGFFIAALVLTIGFFTGGAGFMFMAPLFQALMTPFASLGIPLSLPALAGFFFVLAPLCLANNLKRFAGWLDSFKRDYLADLKIQSEKGNSKARNDEDCLSPPAADNRTWEYARNAAPSISYFTAISKGILATANNNFSSLDAELCEKALKK